MILFVDDERRRMDSYVQDLVLSGHKVEFKSDVDSALKFFVENQTQIKLLILDIMMPTGVSFDDDQTHYGLRTGIAFYQKIREENPSLPTIIFTNVSDENLAEEISRGSNVLFYQKDNFLPFELEKEVRKILNIE
ncbi:MAG: response regulator [Nostoc sp. DedQUE12b]|uniref:response regulator n=1 Tax=Nostoc sp. DedQUE12b TaxID=3075398 RepID=UPI002AD2D426|nr:response regulator [Nostoc sp. DedQUE12b]MDZ8086755.1 response regulator [Nostoc sp. DedQUE12b]